jgi:predicted nucleotide-binding protein
MLLMKQSYRARQNVLLELGFFLGKLGRPNVRTLYEEGVEIPSDHHPGVILRCAKRSMISQAS